MLRSNCTIIDGVNSVTDSLFLYWWVFTLFSHHPPCHPKNNANKTILLCTYALILSLCSRLPRADHTHRVYARSLSRNSGGMWRAAAPHGCTLPDPVLEIYTSPMDTKLYPSLTSFCVSLAGSSTLFSFVGSEVRAAAELQQILFQPASVIMTELFFSHVIFF